LYALSGRHVGHVHLLGSTETVAPLSTQDDTAPPGASSDVPHLPRFGERFSGDHHAVVRNCLADEPDRQSAIGKIDLRSGGCGRSSGCATRRPVEGRALGTGNHGSLSGDDVGRGLSPEVYAKCDADQVTAGQAECKEHGDKSLATFHEVSPVVRLA